MVDVELDAESKGILRATLASPKSLAELSRIFGIRLALCWERVSRLESLGLLRCVFSFVARDGRTVRYYEAELPVETMDALPVVARQSRAR